ncbi:hypothetical protein CY35_13G113800 [Sphagnum magellanicum]|nr:hypothetical protein CY35_13G113800 [Sphagnum magellanicum]
MWPSTSYSSSWRFLRGSSFRSSFLQLGAKPPPALIPMDQLLQSSSPKRSQISQQHVVGGPEADRRRLVDVEEQQQQQQHQMNEEQTDHLRSLYSQHLMSAASASAYGFVGLLMGFVNKAVLMQWPYPNSFLTLQMVASILVVYAMKAWGLATVQPLQLRAAKALCPVVFFYNTNVAFALAAVKSLSIPVYHVLKRLTPVMVLVAKFILGGAPPSKEVTLSVLTVVSGCIMAGIGDLSFEWSGYSAAFISCALQTTYLLLVERSGSEKGFNSMELLLYNGILSLPVLIGVIFATGEVWDAAEKIIVESRASLMFLPLLAASLLMGSLLNYCLFLCTLCNSALTTTIVGTLRSVLGTVMGFFVFGGVKATVFILLGVTFNTAGGVWYTAIKFKEKHMKERTVITEQHNGSKVG